MNELFEGFEELPAPLKIEYRCAKCKGKTPPPVSPNPFVLCPCGYMTSASAAERIIQAKDDVGQVVESCYSPHAVAYADQNSLRCMSEKGHSVAWIANNEYWKTNPIRPWVTPLFGPEYVSGLVEEIKNLQGRVTMIESYEDEFARLLREAEAQRDALREQLVRAGIQPEPFKPKEGQ